MKILSFSKDVDQNIVHYKIGWAMNYIVEIISNNMSFDDLITV